MTNWQWQQSDGHLSLTWQGMRPCLSSAVFNGGYCEARSLLNLRVSGDPVSPQLTPEQSLHQAAEQRGLASPCIGMMTSASMTSLRYRQGQCSGENTAVLLSCGLGNARRAGDPADWSEDPASTRGTINSILITDLQLTVASQAELLCLLSEAKAAVLQELGITSPLSGRLATGTGTDATVIIGGCGRRERWFGKHTSAGETIAKLYMEALRSSIVDSD